MLARGKTSAAGIDPGRGKTLPVPASLPLWDILEFDRLGQTGLTVWDKPSYTREYSREY